MNASNGVRLELSLIAKHRNKKVLEELCRTMGVSRESIRERKGIFEARLWFKGKQKLMEEVPTNGGGSPKA